MERRYAVRTEPSRLAPDEFERSSTFAEARHLVELLVRDYVTPWYQGISQDPEATQVIAQTLLRAVRETHRRARAINAERFARQVAELLRQHLAAFNAASAAAVGPNGSINSNVLLGRYRSAMAHLAAGTPAAEMDHLCQYATVLLAALVPDREYSSLVQTQILTRVLARTVLAPSVNLASDPVYVCRTIANLLGPVAPDYLTPDQLLALYPDDVPPPPASPLLPDQPDQQQAEATAVAAATTAGDSDNDDANFDSAASDEEVLDGDCVVLAPNTVTPPSNPASRAQTPPAAPPPADPVPTSPLRRLRSADVHSIQATPDACPVINKKQKKNKDKKDKKEERRKKKEEEKRRR